MTCACCAASEVCRSGEMNSRGGEVDGPNVAEGVAGTSGGGTGGVNGEVADEGNKPVTTKTHVGSPQPAIVEGNAGGFAAVVGSTRAIKGSTVLPAPPLAAPVAKEFVIVPTGKLEPGTDSEGKLTNVAFAPAKAPTALFAPPIALPVAAEASMLPKFAPTNPPMTSRAPTPVTEPFAIDCSTVPRFTPTKPPR